MVHGELVRFVVGVQLRVKVCAPWGRCNSCRGVWCVRFLQCPRYPLYKNKCILTARCPTVPPSDQSMETTPLLCICLVALCFVLLSHCRLHPHFMFKHHEIYIPFPFSPIQTFWMQTFPLLTVGKFSGRSFKQQDKNIKPQCKIGPRMSRAVDWEVDG